MLESTSVQDERVMTVILVYIICSRLKILKPGPVKINKWILVNDPP